MFDQAANAGSSLAGNYAVRQAVDVGTDTMLDTARAVARGEDVNAKTIGRDLLTNTLMAGARAAGGSGKNGIVDGSGNGKAGTDGIPNNIKPDPDVAESRSVFKTGGKGTSGAKGEYTSPAGGGGITSTISANGKTIDFGHGGRHLKGTGLNVDKVNQVLAKEVSNVYPGTGQFYKGQTIVDGVTIEYTSYGVKDGLINIGTYYPIKK